MAPRNHEHNTNVTTSEFIPEIHELFQNRIRQIDQAICIPLMHSNIMPIYEIKLLRHKLFKKKRFKKKLEKNKSNLLKLNLIVVCIFGMIHKMIMELAVRVYTHVLVVLLNLSVVVDYYY